jgi:hypothetical protein
MGKDKKEKNPADAFRKEQRKKELLKLKKDRAVVREVHEMLNDPRKIDAEIAKVQKESNDNKLDKTLKDRIKELQRMKEVAQRKQLILVAQGKITKEEADSRLNPSIYQSNPGLSDIHASSKPQPVSNQHTKAASRISTEGLPTYSRGDTVPLASSIPVPTSVMMPYPPALTPQLPMHQVPRGLPIAGLAMGGVGGIPLPPPRPMGGQPPPPTASRSGVMPPPPPPRPSMPVAGAVSGYALPPPPPPRSAGWAGPTPPSALLMTGQPVGYPPPGYPYMQQPMYAAPYGQLSPYGPPAGMPYYPGYPPQVPRPGGGAPPPGKERERKARPVRSQRTEEVDPLDPAGKGYTERFGTEAAKKVEAGRDMGGNESAVRTESRHAVVPAGEVSMAVDCAEESNEEQSQKREELEGAGLDHYSSDSDEEDDVERTSEQLHPGELEPSVSKPGVWQPPAQSFGTALSVEELMRRRNMVPSDDAGPVTSAPPPGPASFGPTLTAEELMRRRNVVLATDTQSPGPGPAAPPDAGQVMGAPALSPVYEAAEVAPQRRPTMPNNEAAEDAEDLMRQKYFIPDVQAEDVDSDQEDDNVYTGAYGRAGAEEGDDGDVSEDEVRSAGQPDDFPEEDGTYDHLDDEDEEFRVPALDVDVGNLFPARLPASFTRLPQPAVHVPQPPAPVSAAKAPVVAKYSNALTFNDYGDDDEDEDEYEVEEPAPQPDRRVQPFAQFTPAPSVPAASHSSGALGGVQHASDISRAIVKGPKIIKVDKALTSLVPNALKKKRPLTSTAQANFQSYKKAVTSDGAREHGQDEDGGAVERQSGEGGHMRARAIDPESLHAATSALLKPASFALRADASGPPAAGAAPKATLVPIAFVAAKATVSSVSAPQATALSAKSTEEDAFAQFFQEIHQLEGSA